MGPPAFLIYKLAGHRPCHSNFKRLTSILEPHASMSNTQNNF
jgi:hypothetical protein